MSEQTINPWLSMWIRPRSTMRFILERYPKRLIHILTFAGAFTHIAWSANFYWYSWWGTLLIWLIMAILTGLFTLYIFGALLKWTGNWLGGSGSMPQIMSAIAWSQIPVLYFFVIETLLFFASGGDSMGLVYTSFKFIFTVWGFIVFLACLHEVQKFSFFKSLINYLLAIVILVVVFVIVNVILALFSHSADCTPKTTVQSG